MLIVGVKMRVRKNKNTKIIILLCFLLLSITVGYAIIGTNLNINGISTINNPTWDVHFENIQISSDNVATVIQAPTIDNSKTTITYSVTLNKPGDYYDFYVDIKNAGTIDAEIISLDGTVNGSYDFEIPDYLELRTVYADGTDFAPHHLLSANSKETLYTHVGFSKYINANQLPSSSRTFNVVLTVNYAQATSAAITRPYYIYHYLPYGNVQVGSAFPSTTMKFDDYRQAVSAHGCPIVVRNKIENELVSSSELVFVLDGRPHIISSESSFNVKKNFLNHIFGSLNCNLFDHNTYESYSCTLGELNISVRSTSNSYTHGDYRRADASGCECLVTNTISACDGL